MRVKICGVTAPEDAALAVALGADLLGLNFWPGSPRVVSLAQAGAIAAAARLATRQRREPARGPALLVGVFVDPEPSFVAAAVEAAGLDLVQLHGDEEPGMLRRLEGQCIAGGRVIRAFRVGPSFDATEEMAPWEACWGFLFDAARVGMYGGTGHEWPWRRVAAALEPSGNRGPERRVLLAGGVAPGRLRALLATAGERRPAGPAPGPAAMAPWMPWGIDVCSGVERTPGRKDPAKLRALFEEVRDVEAPTPA